MHEQGGALQNCWGFIDGTVRPLCRPGENQRLLYNGHKRVHSIKFQSVVTPSGMIANLYGPMEGEISCVFMETLRTLYVLTYLHLIKVPKLQHIKRH